MRSELPSRRAAALATVAPGRLDAVYRVFLVLYALAFGAIAGLGSAYWTVRGDYPIGRTQTQAWIAWPQIGSRAIDPYARAILSRSGDIPLGLGEGMQFLAVSDDHGGTLDARCVYRLAGLTPAARYWTLTLYDAEGRLLDALPGRSAVTSSEVLRDEVGRFEIVLARSAQPGNWLQVPQSGTFQMVLRLYDTPASGTVSWLDPGSLPAVSREACRP